MRDMRDINHAEILHKRDAVYLAETNGFFILTVPRHRDTIAVYSNKKATFVC